MGDDGLLFLVIEEMEESCSVNRGYLSQQRVEGVGQLKIFDPRPFIGNTGCDSGDWTGSLHEVVVEDITWDERNREITGIALEKLVS